VPVSSFLLGSQPDAAGSAPPSAPPTMPPRTGGGEQRSNNALMLIAGVGVLLLAMGVGVLIGRSSAPKQVAGPAQVISVNSAPTSAGPGGASEASFSDDWPAGTSGYTVELQTLPSTGTSLSAVEAAKTAAAGKGATAVGALKSADFSSLTAGSYVIYSGRYHTRAQAEKARTALKKSFPGATVVRVSNTSSPSSPTSTSPGAGSPSTPSSLSHPAPPTVLKGLSESKGKSYEEKSKNLPDNVET
jgi:SPOR domain